MSRGQFLNWSHRKSDLCRLTMVGAIATVAIYMATMAQADSEIVLSMMPGAACAHHTIEFDKTDVGAFLPPRFAELTGSARPVAPGLEKLHCYDTEYGWIFAGDSKQARELAEDVRAAAATFQHYFGKQPGRGAVVVMSDVQSLALDGLRKAGAKWLMPWMDQSQLAAKLDLNSIRVQVRQQMGSSATEEQVDQVINQIRSQIQGGGAKGADPSGGTPPQVRPLRHEFGHIWFTRTIYGINLMQVPRAHISPHYGGPAPAWLDETAAILMEDDAITATRRQHFQSLLQRSDQRGLLIPLAKLFTMKHPLADTMGRQAQGKSQGQAQGKSPHTTEGQTKVTLQISAANDTDPTAVFYEECRSLIDFLLARTHNPHLWLEIAEADKRHLSTAVWLAQNGPHHGLPDTVTELEKQWLAWAKQQAGR